MSPPFTFPLPPLVERLSQIKTRQVAIGVFSTLLFPIGPSTFVSCFFSIYRLSCPPPTNHMALYLISSPKAPWATYEKSHPRRTPLSPQQRARHYSTRMGQAIWSCCPYGRPCRSRTTDVHQARGFTSDSCQGLAKSVSIYFHHVVGEPIHIIVAKFSLPYPWISDRIWAVGRHWRRT